jgi:hypothetical protein
MTIHAAGCEFICETVDDKFDGFLFERCETVTLKGPLVVDGEVMPYFQGTVEEVTKKGEGMCDIKVRPFPGYLLRPRQVEEMNRGAVFDPDTGALLTRGQWGTWKGVANADGTVTLSCTKGVRNMHAMAVGRIFALEGYAQSFIFRECRNMTIDGMDSFAGGAFGGHGIEGRFTVRNFRLIPRPGTNRLVANQVAQFDYRCDLTVEDSEFGMGWDDGINYMGKMGMVYHQVSPKQILAGRDPAPGSTLRFFNYDNLAPLGSAVVASCQPVKDDAVQDDMKQGFEAFLAARKQKGNWYKHPSLVTFTEDFAVPDNAVIDEIVNDKPCAITVRRTVWQDQSASVICVKGVKHGTIENNLFIRSAGSGVWIGFDFYWAEGPIPNDVAIRGNVFKRNPWCRDGVPEASIFVGAGIPDAQGNGVLMHGMVIEDNKILAPSCGGIFLGNVEGGIIRNNVIDFSLSDPPELPQYPTAGAIKVSSCRDVIVEGNRITCTSAFPNEILVLDGGPKENITVKNNMIVSAPLPEQMVRFVSLLALQHPQGRMGWRFQEASPGSSATRDIPTTCSLLDTKGEAGNPYFLPKCRGDGSSWSGTIVARANSVRDVAMTFEAPRAGKVLLDCDMIVNEASVPGRIEILRNGTNLWPKKGFETVEPASSSSAHVQAEVAKGDLLQVRVSGAPLLVNPIVTYAGRGN